MQRLAWRSLAVNQETPLAINGVGMARMARPRFGPPDTRRGCRDIRYRSAQAPISKLDGGMSGDVRVVDPQENSTGFAGISGANVIDLPRIRRCGRTIPHRAVYPPSITSSLPVTNLDSSEIR